ncbi:hypothetical protein QPL79_02265 [Ignisphaera sp. 4213-co]|uniref:Uncharacterized protein n=1 Tax=Ignisphaera cupida TaxID=3050454 RepID=A0ABD4Z610_9CREN|nr:hypothetical protein [Ignisphaera sp. 4213-co]MDK6028189.1 hypothetical protein [Ignisphaera sp. 4213-co]
MSFAKYAAIVKNLRGVVLIDFEEDGAWKSLKWLISRFKYRNLGLTPSIIKRYGDKLRNYLNRNPFKELVPPTNAIQMLIEKLYEASKFPYEIVELLVFSSTYISPAMVIGSRYVEYVKRLSVDGISVCKDLDVNSWKLHMRIADYTILDFYEECINEILKIIEQGVSKQVLEHIAILRKSRIEKDKKRYWRIACSDGNPLLYYIDMIDIILRYNAYEEIVADQAAALAIVPVIIISQKIK